MYSNALLWSAADINPRIRYEMMQPLTGCNGGNNGNTMQHEQRSIDAAVAYRCDMVAAGNHFGGKYRCRII